MSLIHPKYCRLRRRNAKILPGIMPPTIQGTAISRSPAEIHDAFWVAALIFFSGDFPSPRSPQPVRQLPERQPLLEESDSTPLSCIERWTLSVGPFPFVPAGG